MKWLAHAVAAVPEDVKPRIAGMVYDWDLWPYHVAAGQGDLSLETLRIMRGLQDFSKAYGLTFYEVTRNLRRALG